MNNQKSKKSLYLKQVIMLFVFSVFGFINSYQAQTTIAQGPYINSTINRAYKLTNGASTTYGSSIWTTSTCVIGKFADASGSYDVTDGLSLDNFYYQRLNSTLDHVEITMFVKKAINSSEINSTNLTLNTGDANMNLYLLDDYATTGGVVIIPTTSNAQSNYDNYTTSGKTLIQKITATSTSSQQITISIPASKFNTAMLGNDMGYALVLTSTSDASDNNKLIDVTNINITNYYVCPLPTPAVLTASSSTSSSINLSWTGGVLVDNYHVSSGCTGYTAVSGTLVPTTSNFPITGLSAGSTHSYRIVGTNECGDAFSNCITLPTIPNTPTLTATVNSSIAITLNWNIMPGATGYKISPCGGSTFTPIIVNSGTTNTIPFSALPNSSYGFSIQATNSSGFSIAGGCITVVTPLGNPTGLTTLALTTSSIQLNWNLVDGASGYRIKQTSPSTLTYPDLGITNTFSVPSLQAGTTYTFQIQALSTNTIQNSQLVSFNPTITYPDAPTAVMITPGSITNSSVILTWNSVVGPNTTTYEVFDCITQVSMGVASTSTTGYITALVPLTNYSLQVKAKNAAGYSIGSICVNFATLISPPVVSPPLALSTNSIKLTWVPVSSSLNPIGYRIKQISPSLVIYPDVFDGTASTSTITGLLSGTIYSFQIQTLATDPVSNSQFVSFTPTITYPDIPTGLVATTISGSKIDLNWNTVTGASSYSVFYCDGTPVIGGSNIGANLLQVTGLSQLTFYEFKVLASNAAGQSEFSSCSGATTLINEPVISATPLSKTSIHVSWNSIPSAVSYDIYDCNGIWLKNVLASTSPTMWNNFTGLTSGTLYNFKIKTIGSTSVSIYSNCVQARPILDVPIVTEEVISPNQIKFTWNNINGAISYDVYNCNGLFYTNVLQELGTTSYIHLMNQLDGGICGINIKVKAICPEIISNSDFSNCVSGFIAPICSPSMTINNQTFYYSQMYKSSGDITISNSTVQNSYALVLESATKVIMNPEFLAQYGSFFQTSLIDCANTNYRSMKIQDSEIEDHVSEAEDLVIYPNPSDGHYRINVFNSDITDLYIINSIGTVVYKNDVKEINEIDISDFSNGVYFVRYKVNDTYRFKKIVKQN